MRCSHHSHRLNNAESRPNLEFCSAKHFANRRAAPEIAAILYFRQEAVITAAGIEAARFVASNFAKENAPNKERSEKCHYA
jgi:hypothetical protein